MGSYNNISKSYIDALDLYGRFGKHVRPGPRAIESSLVSLSKKVNKQAKKESIIIKMFDLDLSLDLE